MLVQKAIFPVAGLGTRFLPATKAQPKEMLPVVDKPLIQYAVEEAYAAGVREMIFVTGRHKRPIEDHFDMTFELEVALEQAKKHELLEVVRGVKPDDMECIYVRQPQALGLWLAHIDAFHVVGLDAANDLQELVFLRLLQRHFQLERHVEMVLDGALVAAGDENHFANA
ncbi:MAG TPA: sugar phosphate nucleotidyltransferase, partial [Rubrivivax sp.]|nr:sugar phosphate nucleotidyltransferase [Rubrivivax sp.]